MGRRHRPTGRARLAVVAAVLVSASACGGGAAPTVPADDVAPVTTIALGEGYGSGEAVARTVAANEDLDMADVVAAALLIAGGGDLEAAIAAGLVGEAEADAALDALERGSLDEILGN